MGSEVGESNWSRVAYVVHSIPFLHTYVRACLVAIVFQCVVECTYVRTYYARRLVRGFKADSSLKAASCYYQGTTERGGVLQHTTQPLQV